MRIIGYVIRGVRLLAAPWRASSQSIWHLNVYHKGSVALFHYFNVIYVSLRWFHWLDLSHLGGWADRRRCPPRPRARIGLAGLGPSSLFSWTSWYISVQGKTRYSQGNYWYQTEVTLDTAQHC